MHNNFIYGFLLNKNIFTCYLKICNYFSKQRTVTPDFKTMILEVLSWKNVEPEIRYRKFPMISKLSLLISKNKNTKCR